MTPDQLIPRVASTQPWALRLNPLYVQFSSLEELCEDCSDLELVFSFVRVATPVMLVITGIRAGAPFLLFFRLLHSWQNGAAAEVARRSFNPLRLDLFPKIDPSDL